MNTRSELVAEFDQHLHEYQATKAKLETDERVLFETVQRMHAAEMSYKEIADLGGWSKEWVRRIVTGQTRRSA